jgi:hypothetical protein
MRFLFETHDVTYAAPATMSRAGILFISADQGTTMNHHLLQRRQHNMILIMHYHASYIDYLHANETYVPRHGLPFPHC